MKTTRSPIVGMRTLKTVLATFLAALFMQYVVHDIPFFACVGALVAVERTMSDSLRASVIRNVGTFTGGVISIAVSSFTDSILWVSLGLIPFIWVSNRLDKRESIVAGGIVYFAVAYLNTMDGAWLYGTRRILGTLLGTLIGLAVNALIFPPKPPEPALAE